MEIIAGLGTGLYTALMFVIALSIIVAVHEYGHYIVGRWSGIKAEVFSLGFGPTLISRTDRHGTRWQIAAVPLGGYVKFLGDANAASAGADAETMESLSPEERRHTMHGAPLWARAATVAAGPVFNFILSIAVFAGLLMWTGTAVDRPTVGALVALPGGAAELQAGDLVLEIEGRATPDYEALNDVAEALPSQEVLRYRVERDGVAQEIRGPQLYPARLAGITPGSPAYAAGLEAGDVITAIDGTPIWRFADLQAAVKAAEGAPLRLTIWREGASPERFEVTLNARRTDTPTPEGGFETRWLIGAMGGFAFAPETRATTLTEAVSGAAGQVWGIVTTSVSAFKHMILGEISTCNLNGAIGIAENSAAAAKSGVPDFIWFIAVLSTAVGFLNLFPIPVLDGGHLMFHLWEGIAGKPPSDRVMSVLMAVGLALVLTLMVFGLSNDIFCP